KMRPAISSVLPPRAFATPPKRILPSGWAATPNACDEGSSSRPACTANLPPSPKPESKLPFAPLSRARSTWLSPWSSVSNPAASTLPSDCRASAATDEEALKPVPGCVATTPPLPKEESKPPPAVRRDTMKPPLPFAGVASPPRSILPSGWSATAFARESGELPRPSWSSTMPLPEKLESKPPPLVSRVARSSTWLLLSAAWPTATILPSGWIASELTHSARPAALPICCTIRPSPLNEESQPPVLVRRPTRKRELPPLSLACPPMTTLPSGCTATAFRYDGLPFEPSWVRNAPSPLKALSGVPSVWKRTTTSSWMPALSLAPPATTILPSGASATALAPESGKLPSPYWIVTRPPDPNVESGVPSELKRVTTSCWKPEASETLPARTTLPSGWSANALAPPATSLSTNPPDPNAGSKLSNCSADAGTANASTQAATARRARTKSRLVGPRSFATDGQREEVKGDGSFSLPLNPVGAEVKLFG